MKGTVKNGSREKSQEAIEVAKTKLSEGLAVHCRSKETVVK